MLFLVGPSIALKLHFFYDTYLSKAGSNNEKKILSHFSYEYHHNFDAGA